MNRGNLSKIFGELMMLIEADKRGPKHAIPLTYSPDGDPFHVPPNLFLIAMMNTADRSLAMVDYALRRRFAFIRLTPAFGTDQFSDFLNAAGVEEAVVSRIVDRLPALNKEIRRDRKNLGPGFEIGHSFFCPREEDEQLDQSWYEGVIRREIKPPVTGVLVRPAPTMWTNSSGPFGREYPDQEHLLSPLLCLGPMSERGRQSMSDRRSSAGWWICSPRF